MSVTADDPTDVEGYVALIAQLRAELAAAPKQERERLAQWFTTNGDDLRALASDGLSIESIVFLLRVDHS